MTNLLQELPARVRHQATARVFEVMLLVIAFVIAQGAWAGHPITDRLALLAYEAQLGPTGSEAGAAILKSDVAFLKEKGLWAADVLLLVKDTPVLAETFAGRTIIAADRLALYRRDIRLFVLAHENSHATHDDTENRRQFIAAQVSPFATPDEMMRQYTELQPVLKAQAYSAEYRADKEAVRALNSAGLNGIRAAIDFFAMHPTARSEWHPTSRARVAALSGGESSKR